MEYLGERGSHADIPLDAVLEDFRRTYTNWLQGAASGSALAGADFQQDVARETGG